MAQQTTIAASALDQIRERGYWRTIIRPLRFEPKRIAEIQRLYPLLDSRAVRLQGWAFPHQGHAEDLRVGDEWVEQSVEWANHLEYWRFYQSGQLFHYRALPEDWYECAPFAPPLSDWQPGQWLAVIGTLCRFTEIFELAARLVLTREYNSDSHMHIEIDLHGLVGRRLFYEDERRTPVATAQAATLADFSHVVDLSITDLMTQARQLALAGAHELFRSFQWNPPPILLADLQDKFART